MMTPPFSESGAEAFSIPGPSGLLLPATELPHAFPEAAVQRVRTTRPLLGLIWPEGGCASTA